MSIGGPDPPGPWHACQMCKAGLSFSWAWGYMIVRGLCFILFVEVKTNSIEAKYKQGKAGQRGTGGKAGQRSFSNSEEANPI